MSSRNTEVKLCISGKSEIEKQILECDLHIEERESIYKKWHSAMLLVAKERSKSKGIRNEILYERIYEIVRLYQPISEEIRQTLWKRYDLHCKLNNFEDDES